MGSRSYSPPSRKASEETTSATKAFREFNNFHSEILGSITDIITMTPRLVQLGYDREIATRPGYSEDEFPNKMWYDFEKGAFICANRTPPILQTPILRGEALRYGKYQLCQDMRLDKPIRTNFEVDVLFMDSLSSANMFVMRSNCGDYKLEVKSRALHGLRTRTVLDYSLNAVQVIAIDIRGERGSVNFDIPYTFTNAGPRNLAPDGFQVQFLLRTYYHYLPEVEEILFVVNGTEAERAAFQESIKKVLAEWLARTGRALWNRPALTVSYISFDELNRRAPGV